MPRDAQPDGLGARWVPAFSLVDGVAITGALVFGAALRWHASLGDLWFDEIWSMLLTTRAHSWTGIFTSVHHDNNHYLNTLWLKSVGSDARPEVYRALSIASGSATIVLVAWAARSLERRAGWIAAWLVAVSPFMIQYSSEARGFSIAMMLCVGAYIATSKFLDARSPGWGGAVALLATLAIFAHLTSVAVIGALALWVIAVQARKGNWLKMGTALAFFSVPVAVLVVTYFVDLGLMERGGGPPWSAREVIVQLASYASGIGEPSWPIAAIVPLLACAAYLVSLARCRDSRSVFYFTAIVMVPAVVLSAKPEIVAARYFAVVVPFVFVLAAAAAGKWLWPTPLGRAATIGVLAVGSILGGVAANRLSSPGRGQYAAALRYIAQESPGPTSVGSDHDDRNGLLIAYHSHDQRLDGRIRYVGRDAWSRDLPEWFIAHDDSASPVPPPRRIDLEGHEYLLRRQFDFWGLSGWHWFVYHRASGLGRP